MIAYVIKNEVVALPARGEILARVIDDMIGPDRSHHLHVRRTAYAGNVGAECFGDLNGKSTHPPDAPFTKTLCPG